MGTRHVNGQRSLAIAGVVCAAVCVGAIKAQAYDLGKTECGGEYGGLSIVFSKKMKSFKDVEARLAEADWSNKKYVNGFDTGSAKTTVLLELKDVWKTGSPYNMNCCGQNDFPVPIGSEKYIAETLMKAGIAQSITHARGYCGGAEISYAAVRKAAVGDISNGQKFESFIRSAVERYVAPAGDSSAIVEGPLSIAPIPPRYPTKRLTVIVPSTVSRGKRAEDTWDKYDLIATLLAPRGSDYLVVVHTENLRVAPKVNSRKTPPTNEHFRALNEDISYEAEFVAAASFGFFLGGSSSRCKAEFDGVEGLMRERCTMTIEYR
ncbi:hypothetical protein B5K05_04045 [Rhizobium phaseoli]|uniref:hypothetical protein n=1 Tax=Rhizobium phaseoli TaxID=396 RepID=UPI000E0D270F|nr:hypothetical protein [Rhizobium phaseoli]RDJ17253.1 hypothetical protein B5K04_04025 [Rhizobium phaseoli]RDJ18846.1 hypothetical protein B5K05_04045 [Rhizobium phaseoli]